MEKINVFDVQVPDWTTIDGVRQLYRRIECKMCFEVIEKLKGL